MSISQESRYIYLLSEFKIGYWSGDTAPTEYYGPVDFTKVAITSMKQEQIKLISFMESNFGETVASVAKPTESATISLEFQSMPSSLFSTLIGADASELSQSTASVSGEVIAPVLNAWIPLANAHIAPHGTGTEIAVTTSADVSIASTHYEVDTINGLFKATSATGATAGKISYHKATRTGEIYAAGKAKSAYIHLVGTGTEKVTQKRCRLNIWKASLAPSGEFNLTGGEFIKGTLAGDILTPTTRTSPWQYEYLDLAA